MLSDTDMVLRLGSAALMGALVGLERERLAWAAGLRTHMLVCVGAALLMIVSSFGFADVLGQEHVTLDPSRVAAQVVSGIGFIGGGTILFLRRQVIRGLTTAASLWVVAAVGLAVGGGLYVAAMATTVIVLVILAVLKPVERRLFGRQPHQPLSLLAQPQPEVLARIEAAIAAQALQVRSITLRRGARDGLDAISIVLEDAPQAARVPDSERQDNRMRLVAALQAQEGIEDVRM